MTSDSDTSKPMLTKENSIKKKIMTEKKTLPSLRNQVLKKVKAETKNLN